MRIDLNGDSEPRVLQEGEQGKGTVIIISPDGENIVESVQDSSGEILKSNGE